MPYCRVCVFAPRLPTASLAVCFIVFIVYVCCAVAEIKGNAGERPRTDAAATKHVKCTLRVMDSRFRVGNPIFFALFRGLLPYPTACKRLKERQFRNSLYYVNLKHEIRRFNLPKHMLCWESVINPMPERHVCITTQ